MTSTPDSTTLDRSGWSDPSRPVDERVAALVAAMTLEEKIAQLYGVWVTLSETAAAVAPAQHDNATELPPWDELTRPGLGQLTRVFGTAPVDPLQGAQALAQSQRDLVANSRLGIPAQSHEECLTGFTAWQATVFPTPLAWGASFSPELVREMAAAIGRTMRSVGVHQGLSPVLDVTRDPRWGRTEETIGEDPYLVGTVGSAYVAGLESSGIVATLKHFAGYSASKAARNLAPVSMGRREFADVILPPFEMGLREGGARSVMNSYADVDGVPAAADVSLLTDLLRGEWGFDGVVVADYFAIAFLETQHRIARDQGHAAELGLTAGIDVELPTVACYGDPLLARVRNGEVSEELIDRALVRVLRQKCELGLLDADWDPEPEALTSGAVDFDPPEHRAIARTLAERGVVLLHNDGTLPVAGPRKVAVVGPTADSMLSLLGCYAFPNHVGTHHPEKPIGVEIPTLVQALRDEFDGAEVVFAEGCDVQDVDDVDIDGALAAAAGADVAVVALGDRSGLFGRGTSGEGCDAEDMAFPGAQQQLLDAMLGLDIPVVVVVLSGRPYALGGVAERAAAIVQAFFPGEEGSGAVAGVLSGRVNPTGKLPVSVPRGAGGQPWTYLHGPLGGRSVVSSTDPTPAFPFGHGLSYTSYGYADLELSASEVATDGTVDIACTVTNTGDRDGAEVVQLYVEDPAASVVRPMKQLVGFARVELAAGESKRVTFSLHADRLSFTGVDLRRIVEPGTINVMVGGSSDDLPLTGSFALTGDVRQVGHDRVLTAPARIG